MIAAQFDNPLPATIGTAATNATASSSAVDRQNAAYVIFDYLQPAQSASTLTTKPLVLRVEHATAQTGAWSSVSGLVGVTDSTAAASNFVIPSTVSSTVPYRVRLNVDCRGLSRYVRLAYTPNVTNNNTVVVVPTVSQSYEAPAALAINGHFANVGSSSYAYA